MTSKTVVHYRRRKAAGLCIRCPQPAMPGFVHCPAHHAIALADARSQAAQRRAQGKCADCSAAADPGRSLCPFHREAKRASAERQRTKRALQRMPTSTTWVDADADDAADVADADDAADEYHPRPVEWGALARPTA